jgi:hypothetical protein
MNHVRKGSIAASFFFSTLRLAVFNLLNILKHELSYLYISHYIFCATKWYPWKVIAYTSTGTSHSLSLTQLQGIFSTAFQSISTDCSWCTENGNYLTAACKGIVENSCRAEILDWTLLKLVSLAHSSDIQTKDFLTWRGFWRGQPVLHAFLRSCKTFSFPRQSSSNAICGIFEESVIPLYPCINQLQKNPALFGTEPTYCKLGKWIALSQPIHVWACGSHCLQNINSNI